MAHRWVLKSMGRRREEKVDEEYLAQLMGGEAAEKIRVKMPNTKVNEMFAIADQILGGRRVNVVCADGKTRMASPALIWPATTVPAYPL